MITYITGKLTEKNATNIIVETGGVGYHINIPVSTYNKIGKVGETIKILTAPHIRPEAWTLYGFASEDERTLFNLLLTVSGVGPKSALAALSGMSIGQLSSAIASNDVDKLTILPGIGKKTAQRIALELKDKIKTLPGEFKDRLPLDAAAEEAVLALEALGYNRNLAERAVAKVTKSGEEQKSDELIRLALAYLTGK